MTQTALDLCSRALVKLGATPIQSFDEDVAEAQLAALLYAGLRDDLFSLYPWSFARRESLLPRLYEDSLAGQIAFQLPTDFIRAIGVQGGGNALPYRLYQRQLWLEESDTTRVLLHYISRVDEASFPPFFATALVDRLALEFCLPLTESPSRAEALSRQAEASFRNAKQVDAQQQTPLALQGFSLISVRD